MGFSQFLNAYYISNLLIIMAYPISRMFRLLEFRYMDSVDELGTTRENTLFYTIIAFVVVKWFKRYSYAQFVSDSFYTIKLALITGYIVSDFRIALCYLSACLTIWLLFKQPQFKGPNNTIQIQTLEDFEELLGVEFKANDDDIVDEIQQKYDTNKKKKNTKAKAPQKIPNNYRQIDSMVFCEFYTTWAETCQFTKEIWADYSLKYSTSRFQFVSVDLQKIPRLASVYTINTSAVSRQLPTIILFENGLEIQRFPPIDKKTGKVGKVLRYDRKDLVKYFELDKRYLSTRELE